jgi:hypothetical protein
MHSDFTNTADPVAGDLHAWLHAGLGAARGPADGRALTFATLISWLLAEGLGAYMLSRWIAAGGQKRQRARHGGVPLPVIFGHAGLAFTGFAAWVSFLVAGVAVLAWLAIGFLALAIGLGISTVTVWGPYPAHRAGAEPGEEDVSGDPGGQAAGRGAPIVPRGHTPADDVLGGIATDEMLTRALSDEALTSKLIDDALARIFEEPRSSWVAPRPNWHLAPLIPAAHGVFAIATFLLATLAAVAAR